MDLREFHQLRTAIQAHAGPGSPADVALVEARVRDLLLESGLFELVETEHTDDPDRLVIGLCRFRPFLVEAEVGTRIEEIWNEHVRYPYWESHHLLVESGHVEFQAATRVSDRGHYVTVHLIAQADRIPAQRATSPAGREAEVSAR
jgi:hypothetical protein